MGRKKIAIRPIQSSSSRRATFEKRRIGLLKKAMELSILCDCTISVTIERRIEGDLQIYSSEPFDEVIARYQSFEGTYRLLTNDHIEEMIPGKMTSNSVGYNVRKRSSKPTDSLFSQEQSLQHAAFQREQMQIIPPMSSIPSPSLTNLYSQLTNSNMTSPHHPSFNGYPPINQGFHFMEPQQSQQQHHHSEMNQMINAQTQPQFNHENNINLNNHLNQPMKRNYNSMMVSESSSNDINWQQLPPPKRFKIDSNSNSNSNTTTSTVDEPINWNEPVQPLEIQVEAAQTHVQQVEIKRDPDAPVPVTAPN